MLFIDSIIKLAFQYHLFYGLYIFYTYKGGWSLSFKVPVETLRMINIPVKLQSQKLFFFLITVSINLLYF